jgi:hypothetical protein
MPNVEARVRYSKPTGIPSDRQEVLEKLEHHYRYKHFLAKGVAGTEAIVGQKRRQTNDRLVAHEAPTPPLANSIGTWTGMGIEWRRRTGLGASLLPAQQWFEKQIRAFYTEFFADPDVKEEFQGRTPGGGPGAGWAEETS